MYVCMLCMYPVSMFCYLCVCMYVSYLYVLLPVCIYDVLCMCVYIYPVSVLVFVCMYDVYMYVYMYV